MFVRLSVGVLVPSHALVFIHTSACLFGIFSAHVRRAIKSASDLRVSVFIPHNDS